MMPGSGQGAAGGGADAARGTGEEDIDHGAALARPIPCCNSRNTLARRLSSFTL
jgi:hypothetical protein